MQILLCAATPFEIQPTINFLQLNKQEDNIEVLITGVGLLATTFSLTQKLRQQKPEMMIQAGIAGSFDVQLPLTGTVIVEHDTVGDWGVMEDGVFRSIFNLGLIAPNEKPWTEQWLVNPHEALMTPLNCKRVKGISVNEITTDINRIFYLKNELGATVESMEGAAFHYIGLQEDIPFLQLRSISNYAGERDKTKWQLKESIQTLNALLQPLLSKFLQA